MTIVKTFMCATLIACLSLARVTAEVTVDTVVDGLDNPCGVAIQPGTGHIFISDSGAKRVVRVIDGKAEDVIVDFPLDVYGKGPMYNIGPLGLAFINRDTLVVGGGGLVDDKELLRVYTVPAAGAPAIKADDMADSFTLKADAELAAEGNYYGVAATSEAIYVTCNGDDTKGWVAKADVRDGKVSNFRRFIATKEATGVDAPVAVAVDSSGRVVIGQMGEITVPEDGLVTIYDGDTGEMRRNFEVGLHDITGLARSPDGKWYATDFAWFDTTKGALVRMTPSEGSVESEKLMSLNKPTAMVFDSDGTLYISVIGSGEKGGKLLKVTGL
jgi:DNA-binding beta-propeller fold protein YncE